jgi:hypothetical protein
LRPLGPRLIGLSVKRELACRRDADHRLRARIVTRSGVAMRDCERGRSVKFRASSACLRSSYDSANVAGARAFASIRSDLMRSRPRSAASWLKIARGGPKAGRCGAAFIKWGTTLDQNILRTENKSCTLFSLPIVTGQRRRPHLSCPPNPGHKEREK